MVTEAQPNPSMIGVFLENYKNQSFYLKDGQYSPDRRHYCRYAGYGTIKTVNTSTGDRALYMEPAKPPVDPNTGKVGTRACSVVFPQVFGDFDWTFKMCTIGQTSPKPNNWETAWVFFRQSDQGHHYYLLIQKNGGLEWGKKDMDMDKWEERQIFLKTTGDDKPTFAFQKWFNMRIVMTGFRLQAYVNGTLYIDATDDGTIGNFGKLADGSLRPRHKPSNQMAKGFNGLYCEDSKVLYTNHKITTPK